MKKLSIYLAGPMRGYPEFNQSAFKDAAKKLRYFGHEVFSPVESTTEVYGDIYTGDKEGNEEAAGIDGRLVFSLDLEWICKHATALAMLPGWENSKGASAEHAVARALGLGIFYIDKCHHGLFIPPSVDFADGEVRSMELQHAA